MNKRRNRYYDKKSSGNRNEGDYYDSIANHNKNKTAYFHISIINLIEYIIILIKIAFYYIVSFVILNIYYKLKIEQMSDRGYIIFFISELISNGGSIYYIIYSFIKFYNLHSLFNQEWTYIYIWIILSIQLFFLFISVILFLTKYIYIKLFLISKLKLLFQAICIIMIIFNFSSLNDLTSDKYSFQIKNFEIKKLSAYKEYFRRHYISLYLNKDHEVNEYELCFEMNYPKNFSEAFLKDKVFHLWEFERKTEYFIGCRNYSFKDNPSIDPNKPLSFFKCEENVTKNLLPNYCISAQERRKKYNVIKRINVFEFFLLIGSYIYDKLIHYIFYNSHEINEENHVYEESHEEEEGEEDNGIDDNEEREEDEDGQEEEEEEEIEGAPRRRNKYRRISKKKKKYYKKKQKKRKNNVNAENQNKEEDTEKDKEEEIENEEENTDINNNNSNEENNFDDNKVSEEKKLNEYQEEDKNDKDIKEDNNNNEIDKNNNVNNDNNNDNNDNNNNNDNDNNNKNDNNEYELIHRNNHYYKRNNFIYQLLFGNIIDKVKKKFYSILMDIDKFIKEEENRN